MGRLCWPTQVPGSVLLPRVLGASKLSRHKEAMARFLASWHKLPGVYACRGTSLVGADKLSRYRIFVGGTGAVSRYILSRSQKLVTVQDFNCEPMRVSGCKNHYKFVLGAGVKAKTVTNNLPILSVLAFVHHFESSIVFIISGYILYYMLL